MFFHVNIFVGIEDDIVEKFSLFKISLKLFKTYRFPLYGENIDMKS